MEGILMWSVWVWGQCGWISEYTVVPLRLGMDTRTLTSNEFGRPLFKPCEIEHYDT